MVTTESIDVNQSLAVNDSQKKSLTLAKLSKGWHHTELPTSMERLLAQYEREIPESVDFTPDVLPNTCAVRKRQAQRRIDRRTQEKLESKSKGVTE